MSEATGRQRSAIVFGARNLGRAVIETLVADGWAVAGVARSQATLDGVTEAGGLALQADVTDTASVYATLQEVAAAHGGVDLALNAASACGGDRTGPFGGGPIADADLSGFDSWAAAPARAAFSFLSASGRFAVDQNGPATLVQVTGGSARRAMPGRGLWSAGAFGVRAISNAAALELRPVWHSCGAAYRRRRHPAAHRSPACRNLARGACRPTPDRRGGPLPGQPGCARGDTRAAAHPAR